MKDFLISKKPLVKFFWNQSYELFQAFKREEVWIGYAWPDAYAYSKGAGLDVEYMNPKEGRITWSCGLGLFADTQNYHHAHAYADSWSSSKAAQFLVGYYYYGHANTNIDLDGDLGRHRQGAQPGRPVDPRAAELERGVLHPAPAGLRRRVGRGQSVLIRGQG